MSTVSCTSTSNNQRLRSVGDNDLRSNAFAPSQWKALCRFLVTDGQNTCDHITRCRRSKPARSNCILCIPFILSGSPNKIMLATYSCTCNTCNNNLEIIRIAASSCLPATTSTIIVPLHYYLLQSIHTCCIHIQWGCNDTSDFAVAQTNLLPKVFSSPESELSASGVLFLDTFWHPAQAAHSVAQAFQDVLCCF